MTKFIKQSERACMYAIKAAEQKLGVYANIINPMTGERTNLYTASRLFGVGFVKEYNVVSRGGARVIRICAK